MDKVAFWKKEDSFEGKGMGNSELNDPFAGTGSFDSGNFSDNMNRNDPFNTGVPSFSGESSNPFAQQNDNFGSDPFSGGQKDDSFAQDPFSQSNTTSSPQSLKKFNTMQQSQQQTYPQQPQQFAHTTGNIEKDIELISVKLDNLKHLMESINQRLINLENSKKQEERRDPWL